MPYGVGASEPLWWHKLILWHTITKASKYLQSPYQGHFEGNAVPIVEVFNVAEMHALDCRILPFQAQNFSGNDTPDPRKSAPGAWTHTPISAWLASVPIVQFFRNDHWPVTALMINFLLTKLRRPNWMKLIFLSAYRHMLNSDCYWQCYSIDLLV